MTKQFTPVNCTYGAPMGRHSDGFIETDEPNFIRLFRVNLDSGGYDDGGAYWGHGEPLYCAIDNDGSRQFVRATHREKAAFMLDIPAPALKRRLDNHGFDYMCALLDSRAPMPEGKTRTDVIEWMTRSGFNMGQIKS